VARHHQEWVVRHPVLVGKEQKAVIVDVPGLISMFITKHLGDKNKRKGIRTTEENY
jgi:hypothetical protein